MSYKNESLEALVAPTLADHPELRDKAAALINTALEEAAKMLATGDSAQRAMMLKFLLPAVFKASNGSAETGADSIRQEFEHLRAEFRGALFTRPGPIADDAEVISFDRPRRITGSTS